MSLKQLSKETQEIVKLITDPYHDFNIQTSGYPDGSVLYSAIQRYQLRTNIACPFTLGEGETWDFHVFALPLHQRAYMTMIELSASNITLVATDTSNKSLGPLNVRYRKYNSSGIASEELFVALGPPNAASINAPNNGIQTRFVSHAFELHNTTAQLYKSGSLTVYRSQSCNEHADLSVDNLTAAPSVPRFDIVAQMPADLNEANQLPSSRTWDAAQGCYSTSLPAHHNTLSSRYHKNTIVTIGPVNSNYSIALRNVSRISSSPLHCAGVISSRYANIEQTFSLDMRLVLEAVPSPSSTLELSYATRAPEYNPQFLKLYKAMIIVLPPACHVNQNASGDWFRMILDTVKQVLPLIPSVLPGPAKPIAATLVPIVTSIIDKITHRNDEQPKLNLSNRMTKSNPLTIEQQRKVTKRLKSLPRSNLQKRK